MTQPSFEEWMDDNINNVPPVDGDQALTEFINRVGENTEEDEGEEETTSSEDY